MVFLDFFTVVLRLLPFFKPLENISNIFPLDFVLFVKNDSFLFLDFDLDRFYDSIENDFFFVN